MDRDDVNRGNGSFPEEGDSRDGLQRFLSPIGPDTYGDQETGRGFPGYFEKSEIKAPRKHNQRPVKKPRKEASKKENGSALQLVHLKPITKNQKLVFDAFDEGKNLMLLGSAGTGKTFISVYLALRHIMMSFEAKQLVIVRSVVQTRDMGFLPGDSKEKLGAFENPYTAICTELFDHSQAFGILKTKGLIEFIPTSFIRGITLNNKIVIVDEAQNLNDMELHSVITRLGENSRIIFCGDIKQCDFLSTRERSGLPDFASIITNMWSFKTVEFTPDDIVRSDLVKAYISMREKLEELGQIRSLIPASGR